MDFQCSGSGLLSIYCLADEHSICPIFLFLKWDKKLVTKPNILRKTLFNRDHGFDTDCIWFLSRGWEKGIGKEEKKT